MIFNESVNNTAAISYEGINESPYDLGIGGALMHVYENECNFNALMKAAALSEMKYYNENGGDLFVQEAGAFAGFFAKVKAFFKKVIDKVISIFKKFVSSLDQFTLSNDKFVKKYGKDLVGKNVKDLTITGYENLKPGVDISNVITATATAPGAYDEKTNGVTANSDSEAINNEIEKNRGSIIGESAMTESEFREGLHEKFYGDKGNIQVENLTAYLQLIKGTDKVKKDAKKLCDDIVKSINESIKKMEKQADVKGDEALSGKTKKGAELDPDLRKASENTAKELNNRVAVYKAFCNDVTVAYAAYDKALIDRCKQAKAACVKALSYKHEAATVAEGAYADIFAGVEIV